MYFQIELRSGSFQRLGSHRISSLEPIYVYFWLGFFLSLEKVPSISVVKENAVLLANSRNVLLTTNFTRLSIGITEFYIFG